MINRLPNKVIYDAADVVFEEAARAGRRMAFAVTDEAAGLVFAARMDETPARILQHAIRKAYTSAVMRRGTMQFKMENLERGKTLADWGSDPMLTHLDGGLPIMIDGELYGGVGVGGGGDEGDPRIAKIALEALLRG